MSVGTLFNRLLVCLFKSRYERTADVLWSKVDEAKARADAMFDRLCAEEGIDPAEERERIRRRGSDYGKLSWEDSQMIDCFKYCAAPFPSMDEMRRLWREWRISVCVKVGKCELPSLSPPQRAGGAMT